jgi:hypothetical protein
LGEKYMGYIGYQQTEELFRLCPTLEGMLESLRIDLNKTEQIEAIDIDDALYSGVIGNKVLTDLPRPPDGNTSDTTGNMAARYQNSYKRELLHCKYELRKDILEIDSMLQKINLSLKRLSKTQRDILTLYYWEQKTWGEIEKAVHLEKRTAQIRRTEALRKIVTISQIDESQYKKIREKIVVM